MYKKKSVAVLLAIFLGPIGAHKFYLKEYGSGIFYFFLTYMFLGWFRVPITFFLGLLDGIRMMNMSAEEFNDKYNNPLGTNRSGKYQSRHRRNTRKQRHREKYQYQPTKRQRKNPFKTSAMKKYQDFDLEDAISDYEQALVISPDDAEIHFNMAAIYSLLENKDKSFFHLSRAKASGYAKMEELATRDDFAFLRVQKDYDAFVENNYTLDEPKGLKAPEQDLLQDDLLLSQLNKLKTLREKGLLSEKEFLYEKEKLLKR